MDRGVGPGVLVPWSHSSFLSRLHVLVVSFVGRGRRKWFIVWKGLDESGQVGRDSLSLKIWDLPRKQKKGRVSEGERDVVMSAL